MPVNDSQRFVNVSPSAVFQWLGQPQRSAERDIIEYLLRSDPTQPVAFEKIAVDIGLSTPDIVRLLFALNAAQALQINNAPPSDPEAYGLQAGVNTALALLAHGDDHKLVVAGGDGLLIAQINCKAGVAAESAAGLATAHGLAPLITFTFRLDRITVYGTNAVNRDLDAWVMLAHHLMQTGGALADKGVH